MGCAHKNSIKLRKKNGNNKKKLNNNSSKKVNKPLRIQWNFMSPHNNQWADADMMGYYSLDPKRGWRALLYI